jgi:Methyltransferase domain
VRRHSKGEMPLLHFPPQRGTFPSVCRPSLGYGPGAVYTMRPMYPFTLRLGLVLALPSSLLIAQPTEDFQRDVIFQPTPQRVVEQMLELAGVTARDVVYDLGSGDGRIPITAAVEYGARGVGIEIDPQLIYFSRYDAQKKGVAGKVEFRREDLFRAQLRDATVVMLFLLPSLNERLKPRLRRQLRPGTRIVSYEFDMGDWKPDRKVKVGAWRTIYLWTVPGRASRNAGLSP